MIQIFDESKQGGTQIYDSNFECYRAKNLKIVNKSKAQNSSNAEEFSIQDIDIDGESLQFQHFVKYEMLKHKIELIVDAK